MPFCTKVTYADIYMGETVDLTAEERYIGLAVKDEREFNLVPQMGADICENEILAPIAKVCKQKLWISADYFLSEPWLQKRA